MPIGILNNIAWLQSRKTSCPSPITHSADVLLQLSSGSRINSGADDAAGLAIANGLQANITRPHPVGKQRQRRYRERCKWLTDALAQVTTLLNRAVTLATESANGTVSTTQRRCARC